MFETIIFSLLNGLVYGLLLFLLSSGLTLIFSMMGVLNLAHAGFYMLSAYFAYSISIHLGFWYGLLFAPLIVGFIGAMVERYGLRKVHKFGHVPELIFTFGVAFLLEELVQFVWGRNQLAYNKPEILEGSLFTLFGADFPIYKMFMLIVSVVIFIILLSVLKYTRTGLIIRAAVGHPNVVGMLGHNVPLIFMVTFGVGTALAGIAGAIAGPVLGTYPGMASGLGGIMFVVVIFGGLGSLGGAFIASLMIGLIQTFAIAIDASLSDVFLLMDIVITEQKFMYDIWVTSLSQVAPLIPYLMMVVMLIFRPAGLMGARES